MHMACKIALSDKARCPSATENLTPLKATALLAVEWAVTECCLLRRLVLVVFQAASPQLERSNEDSARKREFRIGMLA